MSRSLLILFLIVVLVGACVFLLKRKTNERYLFLEIWLNSYGEVIEGEARSLMIDFPTYTLSKDERLLSGTVDFDMNSSLIMILGKANSLSGDAGGGVSSYLEGIYSLPYDAGMGIRILGVEDGTVRLSVNGTEISLGPGKSWETRRDYTLRWERGTLRIEETLCITNFGYVKLQPWSSP